MGRTVLPQLCASRRVRSAVFVALAVTTCACPGPDGEDPPDGGDGGVVCASEDDCDGDGVPRGPDCDDLDAQVHPGATEVPGNVRDDDCDPTTLDGDRITLPAARGQFWEAVPVDLLGAGTGRVGAISIGSSVGTVVVDGIERVAFVDERVPWPDVTYDIYQVLALSADDIVTLWGYCNGPALEWIYLGGVDDTPLTVEQASGTCADLVPDAWVDVEVPAMDLPLPPLLEGFELDGPALRVSSGAPGMIRRDAFMAALLPFRLIDCSTGCGTPGWYELHSLLWEQNEPSAAFAIVYIYLDPSIGRGRDVAVLSSRSLPTLQGNLFPDYTFFDVDVTVP